MQVVYDQMGQSLRVAYMSNNLALLFIPTAVPAAYYVAQGS